MSNEQWNPTWLQGYASDRFNWKQLEGGQYWRRLGLVEGFFDIDGNKFEGRADLNMNLHLEVRTSLDLQAFRQRIIQAWSILRHRHVLLATKVAHVHDILPNVEPSEDRAFVYTQRLKVDQLLDDGHIYCDFLDEHHPRADPKNFYLHLMNTGRAIHADICMSRLIVMPFKHTTSNTFKLNLVLVAGHQVADGLTTFRWMNSFISLLNTPSTELQAFAHALCTTNPTSRFPPAQESLYPPISGSPARQRWFWLITRILRHTARVNPPCFANPLCRITPLERAQVFPEKYHILDYKTPPRNNAYIVNATLSASATANLIRLCRSTTPPISIGSGLFVLVALSMMTLHERLPSHTHCPSAHLPFIGSFPLNPRPFLSGPPTTGKEDSLMLSFSDGIALPFLPSALNLEGRFKLLGLQAARQLKMYQKRKRSVEEELALGARGSKFLLPTFYLASQDRWKRRWEETDKEADVDSSRSSSRENLGTATASSKTRKTTTSSNTTTTTKKAPHDSDFQGSYPPSVPSMPATCGISSVGDRTPLISAGKYDVATPLPSDGERDVAADFRNAWSFVRPRDGEFLVGAAGSRDGEVNSGTTKGNGEGVMTLSFGVSYDGNVIDPERVGEWKDVIEGMLESRPEAEVRRESRL